MIFPEKVEAFPIKSPKESAWSRILSQWPFLLFKAILVCMHPRPFQPKCFFISLRIFSANPFVKFSLFQKGFEKSLSMNFPSGVMR